MNFEIDKIIINALIEDMPEGDVTTDNLISDESYSECRLIAKAEGCIAGTLVFSRVFDLVEGNASVKWNVNDGDLVSKGQLIATIKGNTKTILKSERVALNILQRMSGVATTTKRFVDILEGHKTSVYDTRKTTPGLRYLEKMAVRLAGGTNHRYCLSDMVMIKDNHIKAAGSITKAVEIIKSKIDPKIKVEVEAENLEMVAEALSCDVDVIMLDNMDIKTMAEAVKMAEGHKCLLEASGNMGSKSGSELVEVARTGVDYISVGDLTHSYTSLDISLKF
jgi:nicotinate-nucleotide pyrophosphorylase